MPKYEQNQKFIVLKDTELFSKGQIFVPALVKGEVVRPDTGEVLCACPSSYNLYAQKYTWAPLYMGCTIEHLVTNGVMKPLAPPPEWFSKWMYKYGRSTQKSDGEAWEEMQIQLAAWGDKSPQKSVTD
jgi:hypothetical protein